MPTLINRQNLLLHTIGNYKNRYNNYANIDDIDKAIQLLYIDLEKVNTDVNELNNRILQIRYYETVAGTSSGNQVNVPTGGTIQLNKFGASGDAILSTVDGNGVPTWQSPRDAGNNIVTTSLDVSGTYVFSSTPVVANVAVVYIFNISQQDSLTSVDPLYTIEETEVALLSDVLDNRITVNQSNVATTLGGVIDSSKEYFIDGVIDLGTTQITVPSTGMTLKGYSFDLSGLTSSEDNYTMFISESVLIGSGNLLGSDYFVSVTGAASKVYELYDATGFNAFEFTRINYIDCTDLGDIYDYRQGLESGTGRFGGSPSLTLHGLWRGGYRITTSIVRSLAGTMTKPLFKEGLLFQMNSRFLSDINCDLPTLAALLDFQPVNFPNPSTLQLQGCEITRDGAYNAEDTNITPNISASDLASNWKRNNGLTSTFVGGVGLLLLEQATTITVQGQFELLNASAWLGNDLQHFVISADGKLKHKGNSPREFEITYNLNLDSQQNNEIYIKYYKYDSSTTTEIPLDYTIQARQVNNLVGGRDVAFFVGTIGVTLDQDDEIYIKVMNNSGTNDITGEQGSYYRLQER